MSDAATYIAGVWGVSSRSLESSSTWSKVYSY
jgi:hypothetical protein